MSTQQTEDNHLVPLYGKRDIAIARAEGVFVYDEEGTEYMDCISGHGAVILGYSHPEFVKEVQDQVATVVTTHGSFYSTERGKFLDLLHELLPDSLSHSFISSTGTESVEASLKFARAATGKPGVISTKRAYHGRTMGALSVNGTKKYRETFEPLLEHMEQVPYNDIDAIREAYNEQIGAIIIEPIQGEGGVYIPDVGYLAAVKAFCEEKQIVCIFDEVQSGIRTGAWLAADHEKVVPDIVCLSKSLGNGFPVAVTVTTAAIAKMVPRGSHGTTFGGNPLACRAARATLSIIQKGDLLQHVITVGEYFKEALEKIETHQIREVRAKGLFIGIDMKMRPGPIVKALQQDHNILVANTGTVIRLLPSLAFTTENADKFIKAFTEVLRTVE